MVKKHYLAKTFLTVFGVGGCVAGFVAGSITTNAYLFRASGSEYTLTLTDHKISTATASYSEEVSANISTPAGNSLTLKASNVINNTSGWQTILPGGYFYNPINSTSHYNKISGIKSIRFESASSCELSLHYGSSMNNSQVIYSHAKTLNSNATYLFNDDYPNYFYIKNNGSANIDITKFQITYSCSDSGYSNNNLNVLMIGNSFSDDTIFYAARIANSYGITLNIYDAYIASCTIATHYSKLNSDAADYSMRSMNGSNWAYDDNKSLGYIIDSHTWDVITFQQASSGVGTASTYADLSNLVSAVRTRVGANPKFDWYQTWAYDKEYADSNDNFAKFDNNQMTMYTAINTVYQSEVASLGVFDKIIPAGTAVQNLRTSYMKDTFTRDGKHMSNVHGRYLLGLNIVSNILDIDLDLSPCNYLPAEANDSFKTLCNEAIRNAYKTPLAVTNSVYTSYDLTGYDLSNYTEIDAELVGCSYWNSTDSSDYDKRIAHVSNTSNHYVSTKRFTQSELPVGSIVLIGESFGIRPEAWVSDAQQSSRPEVRYDNYFVVDSSFWSGYQYRAFNIFKENTQMLTSDGNLGYDPCVSEQYSQIFDNFHLYVPNASLGSNPAKGNNSYYTADKAVFTANSYNIDLYKRLHLDPITGFQKCDSYYYLKNSYVDSTAQRFVCTRAFYFDDGDLPVDSIIIVDSGYQWRSDCWGASGTHSRPNNVSTQFTVVDNSFVSGLRRRTFNVSKTDGSTLVGQDFIEFMNHMRIYVPDYQGDIAVTGITISDSSKTLAIGTTYQLTANVTPLYATNKNISWSSSKTSVATVASDGTVTAVAAGSATITATTQDGGYTATCAVTVTALVSNYPEGTFVGSATVLGSSYKVVISIGTQLNGLVGVRLANSDAVATSIDFNSRTNKVTITTTGSYSGYSYGNITGTYDKTNNQIKNINCSGSISQGVSNNGSIICTKASGIGFFDCDGTTSELQSTFKRRYMSGSWQVDNSNADRITSNTTEFVCGTGSVKRRGYSGNAVALNFQNDFSPALTCANVQFWVYNPSSSDITLRMWGYKGTNLQSNFETGSVTAKAGQWTYVAMGFTSASIYNFQIADFNNTGVYLSFDNIYLF